MRCCAAQVVINTRVELVRWLLVHLIAVNLVMWIEWITFETSQEVRQKLHLHYDNSLRLESGANQSGGGAATATSGGQSECLAAAVHSLYSVALVALNASDASPTTSELWRSIAAAYQLAGRDTSCSRPTSTYKLMLCTLN